MTITYRATKGTDLTPSEVDGNFSDLELRTADGWADIVAELYTRGGPSSPVPTTYKGGIYLYEFTPTDTLEVFSNFHIPHTWKLGSMLYPHLHFVTTSNATGVVRIGFEYTYAQRTGGGSGDLFGNTSTIVIDFTIPSNSADKHFVVEAPDLGGIPGTTLDVDGMVLCRIYREGAHVNDTFADSIWGITADMHIEVDKASTPFRAQNFMTGP
jgi:hypothetical protein